MIKSMTRSYTLSSCSIPSFRRRINCSILVQQKRICRYYYHWRPYYILAVLGLSSSSPILPSSRLPIHVEAFTIIKTNNYHPNDHYYKRRQSTSSSRISSRSLLSSSSSYTKYTSFGEFLHDHYDTYDAYILDQFGVLHNGVHALDGAIECVQALYNANKKLIILSNTSAPSKDAMKRLPKFGFDSKYFIGGAITSGEEASKFIKNKYRNDNNNNNKHLIHKALFLTWDVSKGPDNPRLTALPQKFLDQCGSNIQIANTIEEATFILCHGSEVWLRSSSSSTSSSSSSDEEQQQVQLQYIENGDLTVVDQILQQCMQRKLPLVCANPDLVVLNPSGTGVSYMPGGIAQRYQELIKQSNNNDNNSNNNNIECYIFGKPCVEHFEACITKLGITNENKHRVCHVGDSLHHDIAGAIGAGIPNIFITSGIHADDLSVTDYGELPNDEELSTLFREQGNIIPTHIVSAFRL